MPVSRSSAAHSADDRAADPEDDLSLLRLEVETLFGLDDRGRLVTPHHAVVLVGRHGAQVVAGASVPDAVVGELRCAAAEHGGAEPSDPSTPPGVVTTCRRLLSEALGPVELSGGPSYLVPPDLAFAAAAVPVVRSDALAPVEAGPMRDARPQGWESGEWAALVEGDLDGWAIALRDGEVVALCHTSAATARAAEVGVWTRPDARGRGYAAAVTAAWAGVQAPSGRRLFYSTSVDNRSSQRVAARLGLRPLGWMWKLTPQGTSPGHLGLRP